MACVRSLVKYGTVQGLDPQEERLIITTGSFISKFIKEPDKLRVTDDFVFDKICDFCSYGRVDKKKEPKR